MTRTAESPAPLRRRLRAVVVVAALAAVVAALVAPTFAPAQAVLPTDGLVAHYAFDETSGTVAHDDSGNGKNATLVGGSTWAGADGVTLNGANGSFVQLPNNITAGLAASTVSLWVKMDATQPGAFMIVAMGNPVTTTGTGYFALVGNGNLRATTTSTNWSLEKSTTAPGPLARGVWKHVTYTQTAGATGTGTLYIDGVQVAQNAAMTPALAALAGGVTTANYLGRSTYAADGYFKGSIKDFRLYNRALDATEVSRLAEGDTTLVRAATLPALASAAVVDAAAGTVTLPLKPGTDVTALAPAFALHASGTISPASGSTQNFTSPVTYTVTGTRGDVRTWTVRADVVNAPAVVGAFSDPTVTKVGGGYWMYASGAGGVVAFSSTDLVTWQNRGVVLGAGSVGWAPGGVGSPVLAEKNGGYYLYFSARAPGTYYSDVVSIGVATAATPAGPFVDTLGSPLVRPSDYPQELGTPSIATDSDGAAYLLYGDNSTLDRYHPRSLTAAPLAPSMTAVGTPATLLSEGTGAGAYASAGSSFVRDGVVYVVWTGKNGTGSAIWYSRADSLTGTLSTPAILMKDAGGRGITGVGHASLVEDGGEWFVAYQRESTGNGASRREIAMDAVDFTPTGDIVEVTPTLAGIGIGIG
ncbi:family 43 glycosylhydrolase [Conyzicola sp.]|uniref:family 43 glycosylhydrolase n=1 Tax=Conyzicola sp. TaxID=1969404 RepID=UPI00398953E5